MEIDEKLYSIQKVDSKLCSWREGLSEAFLSQPDSLNTLSQTTKTQRTLIDVLYHQSLSVLHASIVPLFALSPVPGDHGFAQAVSAQTALHHAREISSLFLKTQAWNSTQAPGFVGYAAYCSCAIQLPFVWCQKQDVSERSLANIKTNSRVMGTIGNYWKLVAGLASFCSLNQKVVLTG